MRRIADCVCERCGGSYQALVVGSSRFPTYFDGPNPCTCTTADWVRDDPDPEWMHVHDLAEGEADLNSAANARPAAQP